MQTVRVFWEPLIKGHGIPNTDSRGIPDDCTTQEKALQYIAEHKTILDKGYEALYVTFPNQPIDWDEVDRECGNDIDKRLWFVAGKYGRAKAVGNAARIGMSRRDAYLELYGDGDDV